MSRPLYLARQHINAHICAHTHTQAIGITFRSHFHARPLTLASLFSDPKDSSKLPISVNLHKT